MALDPKSKIERMGWPKATLVLAGIAIAATVVCIRPEIAGGVGLITFFALYWALVD